MRIKETVAGLFGKLGSRRSSRESMARPNPIWISRRVRTSLLLVGIAALVTLMWAAPIVPVTLLGGFSLALVLSFPVRALSRFMPRGLATLVIFLVLFGLGFVALFVLVPILIGQLAALIEDVPAIASSTKEFLHDVLATLSKRGLLQGDPNDYLSKLGNDLRDLAENVASQVLNGLVAVVSGTFDLVMILFGVLFVAVYFLLNARVVKASYLRAIPIHYRPDARDLWDALGYSLSRYLSGLAFDMSVQGVLSFVGLLILGVPYALLLAVWVAIVATIPYLGPVLGAIPAVLVALTVSPTTAVLTVLLYIAIQQLEGYVLQPQIQQQAIRMPSILILLAVLGGAQIAGLLGVIFAVPALAVAKVLFEFFRVRLRIAGQLPDAARGPVRHHNAQDPREQLRGSSRNP